MAADTTWSLPDLPADDESATLDDYADAVIEAIATPQDLVVVGQSFGAFTAPIVADRLGADRWSWWPA